MLYVFAKKQTQEYYLSAYEYKSSGGWGLVLGQMHSRGGADESSATSHLMGGAIFLPNQVFGIKYPSTGAYKTSG